jgi:hypothetical protein
MQLQGEQGDGRTEELLENLQAAMRKHMSTRKLRFLLYPSGLLDEDLKKIRKNKAGVIWLGT